MFSINTAELATNLSLDPNILIFLLTLPIVITIFGFSRYIIGVKSYGIYVPLILTYMFYEFSTIGAGEFSFWQGLKYGLFLTVIVFVSAFLSYRLIKSWSLHYYSKLAIVITTVAVTLIATLVFVDLVNREGLLKINIFSLILIATIAERYMNMLAFKETRAAIILSVQTVGISIFCFWIISLQPLQQYLLDYPLLILLTFPTAYIIGKFTGLRLTEYYRFQEILTKEPDSPNS